MLTNALSLIEPMVSHETNTYLDGRPGSQADGLSVHPTGGTLEPMPSSLVDLSWPHPLQ
jgi:hypothetical protein